MSDRHSLQLTVDGLQRKRKPGTGNPKPFIIAITGPTCSGKTTAAEYLAKNGYTTINVDKLAHALYVKGTPLYALLKKKYGSVIINDNGEINRKILGAKVLSSKKTYGEYCAIIYPVMNQALSKAVKSLGQKVIVLDMAVVFESGFYKKADAVIYIQPSEVVLRKAMLKRGNVSFSSKISSFQSLFSPSKKIALSDYVIYNNSTVKKLTMGSAKIVSELLEEFNESTGRKRRTNTKDS